jgi:molybdopterin/thiamine biosynthesis adenylyltransferase
MAGPHIRDQLTLRSVERRRPDGSVYRSLSSAVVQQLAREFDQSLRRVEQSALEMAIIPERYIRNVASLSPEDQHRLLDCSVCVVGVGGLGGSVAEMLARIGVGRLRLVDGDRFEESNLNRQRFADTASLDKPKAQIAREAIAAINPAVEVTALTEYLTTDNGPAIIGDADIAIDCLDSLPARLSLQTVCRNKQIPMVSAAVAGMSGQITVFYPEDEGLAALYGDLSAAADRGAETTLGNLPFAVTMLASLECSEAVKILLGRPQTLHGRLLIFDLTDLTFDIVQLAE